VFHCGGIQSRPNQFVRDWYETKRLCCRNTATYFANLFGIYGSPFDTEC
jgi:hypothetical protein